MTNKGKVLLVDDDIGAMENMPFFLTLEGYDVLTAADGQEGLEAARKYNPDVIVTDYDMPRMNGYQLSTALMPNRPKMILMTEPIGNAFKNNPELNTDFTRYFDGFLKRPVDIYELLAEVRRVLESRD